MNEVGIAHNGSVHVGVDYFDIIPVWTCSRNVSKRCSFSESRPHINVPTTAPRKPRGSDTTVGLTSGHNASAPRIAGPIIASITEDTRPTVMPPTTPPVLNRRQNSERISTGKLALAATQIARITSTATLTP